MTTKRGQGKGIAFLREHVSDPDGDCLIWPLSCDNHGYAVVGYNGQRPRKAARVMCEMVNGPAPSPKHHTAHSCGQGQGGCVHPQHVRWATPKENMEDSVKLGAVRQPGRPFHKLTEEQVAEILSLRGTKSYSAIGAMFGVKGKQIGKILRGEQWKGGKRTFGGFKPGDPRNAFRKNPRAKGGYTVSAE
jgi:hypothetical protein